MSKPQPDWEAFGKRVFALIEWPEYFYDIEGPEVFELAKEHNLVREIPGGFNPEIHDCPYGSEPGDPWYTTNFEG